MPDINFAHKPTFEKLIFTFGKRVKPILIVTYGVLFSSLILTFLSCSSSGRAFHQTPVDSSITFSTSGDADVPDEWWRTFNDQSLNASIDTALSNNYNLRTAYARLQAAEAVVIREKSSLIPNIFGSADTESSTRSTTQELSQTYWAALSAEYELDLWGRIRANLQAAQFQADASYYDYQTAALTLSAEITRTWFQIAEAQSQLELIQGQIDTNEKVLSLIKARFGSGQIRSVDILRQRQLLESTLEQKYIAESRLSTLQHTFAVLLGHVPQMKYNYTNAQLPDLPSLPETGIPAELIRRRPDIQSAFHLLEAADKEVAVAITNQYPRISLSASYSSTANSAEKIFEDWVRSFAGNIFAPLLYGGELKAEVSRAKSVKSQRFYEYSQETLVALREVEDALIREQKQVQRINSLESQVQLSQQTYEQLRVEYFNGVGDYLDVLTALDQEQQLRRDLLSARLTLVEYRISLYRSLAGGFETDRTSDLE